MTQFEYKQFSRRRRPHIQPPGARLFVTYRLAGSVPQSKVREYKAKKEWLENQLKRAQAAEQAEEAPALKQWVERVEEFNRHWFLKFEEILDQAKTGPMWMRDEKVAKAVADSLHALDGKAYELDAYSVMSNHVHTIFKPFVSENNLQEGRNKDGHTVFTSEYPSLEHITQSLKGSSARKCNLILSRSGSFWEHESFDHVIRPGKFSATMRYVLNNPVKAGLTKHWRDWLWNYCRNELSDKL
jgi:REP element-mobilizing transposase RayT